jgi:hypothetical protein
MAKRRRALMLALALASLAATDRAQAACLVNNATPASPVINQNVNCTGPTSGGAIGFGSDNDQGNTYTIVTGAAVTGSALGLDTGSGATTIQQNEGTIAGGSGGRGIESFTLTISSNTGTISGGEVGIISAFASITNSGTISATDAADAGGARIYSAS